MYFYPGSIACLTGQGELKMEKFNYPNAVFAPPSQTILLDKNRIVPPCFDPSTLKVENITVRTSGLLKHIAIYLPRDYDWVIVRDEQTSLCLVQLIKE